MQKVCSTPIHTNACEPINRFEYCCALDLQVNDGLLQASILFGQQPLSIHNDEYGVNFGIQEGSLELQLDGCKAPIADRTHLANKIFDVELKKTHSTGKKTTSTESAQASITASSKSSAHAGLATSQSNECNSGSTIESTTKLSNIKPEGGDLKPRWRFINNTQDNEEPILQGAFGPAALSSIKMKHHKGKIEAEFLILKRHIKIINFDHNSKAAYWRKILPKKSLNVLDKAIKKEIFGNCAKTTICEKRIYLTKQGT